MTGLFAPTLLRTIMSRKLTSITTTKRNRPILRKVRDVTLTYSVILLVRITTPAQVECQNDRGVGANILSYNKYCLADNLIYQVEKTSHF